MLINPDPPLLTIGELARRTDLTVKALRHYDDADVLRPAVVDPWTGHRRYAEAQVGVGRLVRRLRGAGLPLADIRLVLQGLDTHGHLTSDALGVVAAHRRRIEARATRLRSALHELTHLMTEENPVTLDETAPATHDPMSEGPGEGLSQPSEPARVVGTLPEGVTHRQLGVDLFNATWRLLEREDRTDDDDALLVHTAHASAYHWRQVGTPTNFARSEWLCARVHAVRRNADAALDHAERALRLCTEHGIGDWDLAFAHEAVARAHAAAGDQEQTARSLAHARTAGDAIRDDEDRAMLLRDLETVVIEP